MSGIVTKEESASDLRNALELADRLTQENAKLHAALRFCGDIAQEELPHTRVGTGAEVALRHIARKARENL